MKIDFDGCDIRTPQGEDLVALYNMLMDIFPPDRPIIEKQLLLTQKTNKLSSSH
ncbi:MAG: hypothetical protein JXM70_10280 [Pirellulales bacterium]|nr:hypothetical protein [Pirellulales bacterium]